MASLSADLRSFDATVRRRAVTACIEDPWLGQTVDVAALMAAASTDDSLGDLAFTALVRAGPPAVEPLIQALNTNDRDVQILAARALRRIGSPDAKPAIPALLQCLESKHRWVRSNAMFAISRLGPDPKDLPAFVRLVDDEHPDVRRWAAKAIGALGAAATSAVPRLERALGDESEMVRAAVAEALGAIGRK